MRTLLELRRELPLLTVLTVVYNSRDAIEDTLRSVAALKGDDVQYVVIDGGSTDGTLVALAQFAGAIDVIITEPDRGIYNAMNKGIGMATGRFILHLNAGDRLLRIPRLELDSLPPDVLAAAFPVAYPTGDQFVPSTGWKLKLANTLHHQGTFYRLSSSLRYDEQYRTYADFDLNQRLRTAGKMVCLPGAVAEHSPDGVSHQPDRFPEVYRIVRNNQGLLYVPACWAYFKMRGLAMRIKGAFGRSPALAQ
jgi:glycosyltransferase involved in cell wall biosynthesis